MDYAVEMIQSADFVTSNIHTGWLDARIAQHVRPHTASLLVRMGAGAPCAAGRQAQHACFVAPHSKLSGCATALKGSSAAMTSRSRPRSQPGTWR